MGKGSNEQTTTQQVNIPDFLRPLLNQGTSTASNALGNLQSLASGNLVAGFNPTQQQAQQLALQRAMGAGGYIPTAQNTFLNAAQGQALSSFLPQAALDEFGNAINGEFLPASSRSALTSLGQGSNVPGLDFLGQATGQSGIPAQAIAALTQGAQGQSLQGTDALRRTANGDYLYGGEGFDQAVQAAVRAAQPNILSTFGAGGVGGASGGLAQAAIGRSAVDAFANQFGQERQNQLNASNQLANLGLANQGQQLNAAQSLGNLGLAGQGQQVNTAGLLSNLGLAGQSQQLNALNALAGINQGQQGLGLNAANSLASFGDAERNRQLTAASGLGDIGLLDANILQQIGGMQQQQQQAELNAPLQAQQGLYSAALGLPSAFSPLFGSTTTQRTNADPFGQLLGGALTGLSLFGTGGLFPLFGGQDELTGIDMASLPGPRGLFG